jgi:hypothetical protein
MSLFAAFLLLAAGRQTPSEQLDRILPPPTGRNGYEEYILAAKEVTSPAFDQYESGYPVPPVQTFPGASPPDPAILELNRHLKGMTYLDIKREEIDRYSRALQLVRAGSLKPVFDPRTTMTPDTIYPEFFYFKRISRLFAAECYVKFADGDSAAGTRSLMDGLAFSYHISGGLVIGSLVGVSSSAILLKIFEGRLPQLSVHDCQDIESVSAQLVAAPMGLKAALEVERKSNIETVAKVLQSASNLKQFEGLLTAMTDNDKAQTKQIAALVAGAQPADFSRWGNESADAVNSMYSGLEAKLALPEAKWFGSDDDMALLERQHSPVVSALVDVLSLPWDNVFAAIAKQRTQFRLLALHGKVLEYRWLHNKLPARLSDAVDATACQDPLSGREFGYMRKGDGYRLFSYGAKPTGEIELVYRHPGAGQSAGGPP